MRTLSKLALLAVGLLTWTSPALRAEMLSGDYTNSFDGLVNLWDISGTYSNDVEGMSLNYTLNTDASGKFTGQGTAAILSVPGYSASLNMGITFNGTVSSAGNVVRANMTMKMTGDGTVEGMYCTFRATMTQNVELDQPNHQMVGSASGRVTVSVPSLHRSASRAIPRTEVQTPLPDGTTGNWDLALTVSTNKTKYVGNATVTLDNGRTFPLVATGSYAPRSNVSTITMKGQDLNRALNLRLSATCTNAEVMVKQLTGKLLGQKLKLPVTQ